MILIGDHIRKSWMHVSSWSVIQTFPNFWSSWICCITAQQSSARELKFKQATQLVQIQLHWCRLYGLKWDYHRENCGRGSSANL